MVVEHCGAGETVKINSLEVNILGNIKHGCYRLCSSGIEITPLRHTVSSQGIKHYVIRMWQDREVEKKKKSPRLSKLPLNARPPFFKG